MIIHNIRIQITNKYLFKFVQVRITLGKVISTIKKNKVPTVVLLGSPSFWGWGFWYEAAYENKDEKQNKDEINKKYKMTGKTASRDNGPP